MQDDYFMVQEMEPADMKESSKFCSVSDVCSELGISRSTAIRLIHEGKIPATKLGKRILVLRSVFETLEDCAKGNVREANK